MLHKVEDADDIQNVPATVTGGSEGKEEKSISKIEAREQETSAIKISSSELPPHIILEMPALSPTMVEYLVNCRLYSTDTDMRHSRHANVKNLEDTTF